MSDIKISQLPGVASLNKTDLFAISRNLGGGSWESNSITADNVLNSLATTKLLKVAKDGIRDADTIKDAIVLATSMSPTEFDPVAIQVFPGSYFEDNPINIPQWVTVYSEGGYYSAAVIAQNDGEIFVGNGNSELNGFTIVGGIPFSNVAYKTSSHTTGTVVNCILINCSTGILSDNGSVSVTNITALSFQRVFGRVMSAINGGFLVANSCNVTGIMTRPTYTYYSLGSGSELYLFNCTANNCVNGIYVNNNGYVDSLSCHYEGCDNNIHIGPNGASQVKAMGCIMDDAVINDLFIESPTSRIAYTGHLDSSKFTIVSGASVNIVADDENTDGGLITGKASLQGKVSVGTPGAITLGEDVQLNVGEGSAFVNDQQGNPIVEYWSYDASLPSGSRFSRFASNAGTQLTNSNDCIIVGCKYQFPAIRLDVNVSAVLGSSDIVTEYWDGVTWIPVTVAAYRRNDFARRANNIFQNIETQFVECSNLLYDNGNWEDDINVLNQIPDWDSGESFYAIRFRNDGALTSGMNFSNGLVKPHSFMVSTSGYKANFGVYRSDRTLYIDSISFTPDPINPPSYVNLQFSPNIGYANLPVMKKANNISQVSTAFVIPADIDTSSPLHVFVDGTAIQALNGDIVSTMYVARIDYNNPPIATPIPDSEVGPEVTTVAGVANAFTTVTQDIDISSYASNDLLFVSFARLAGDPSDTYNGDFIVVDIIFRYKSKFV